ncbi:MAG: cobalamin B12-binding domain-containing protein [Ardenticatenaceae bacterium]|nr:cobalamin-dependent protein [Anaerolineales bacterium]MCB8940916.1 cobalamin B12-binding domain-containing protein [Ardenticatenaceae bacterium]MCB8972255.1 cobalamin B12-binding domain-containing protein [Ardenticatenaceae bacterium]
MIENTNPSLPTIHADMLFLHAPAVFDFRDRTDIYFPYLSTSGDVPITPLYEYFPLGFKSLKRYLTERGHTIELLNLSSLLLKYSKIDVRSLFRALDIRLLGIDLHWMVHVQGSLAIAELFKQVQPHTPVIFGGISSTYYAHELIQYPFVDMVMRGYDTHQPMNQLLAALDDERQLAKVPNLLWKNRAGEVVDNGLLHVATALPCGIDWSTIPIPPKDGRSFPIQEVIATQNAGCPYNCGWCGGSRDAYLRINQLESSSKSTIHKPLSETDYEFQQIGRIPDKKNLHFYTVNSYSETHSRFDYFLDLVGEANFKSVSYEQFKLTPDDVLRKMAATNPRTSITLSPESHDVRVAKLAGRGAYTPAEMEAWIAKALDIGIYQIDIWYFVGMPDQDEASVRDTLAYCDRLLKKFEGQRVYPYICPMIPFLDPGSTFFEQPAAHGYRLFHRSLEEHRRGMQRASIINRVNYETNWLSRADLVHVGLWAVQRLTELKIKYGIYPRGMGSRVCQRIEDALTFIDVVHEIDCLPDPQVRRRELASIGDEILQRNQQLFRPEVANQAFPLRREIGGRWFDELVWDEETLEQFNREAVPS